MPAFGFAGTALRTAEVVVRVMVDGLIPTHLAGLGCRIQVSGRAMARQFGASLDAIATMAADTRTVVRDPRLAILVDALGRRATYTPPQMMHTINFSWPSHPE